MNEAILALYTVKHQNYHLGMYLVTKTYMY